MLPLLKIIVKHAVGRHKVSDGNYIKTMRKIRTEYLELFGDSLSEDIVADYKNKEEYVYYQIEGICGLFVLTGHDSIVSAHTLNYVNIEYTDGNGVKYDVELG